MAIGQVSALPYYAPPLVISNQGSSTGTNDRKNDELARELAQLDEEARIAQEAFAKRLELIQVKAQNREIIDNLQAEQDNAEKAYREYLKFKQPDGSIRADSGKKGAWRWISNAGTALWNMGKSIAGFDKDGKWDPLKCLKNVCITAAAIGATFIPGVGPAIGYGLLATGVVGGTIGVAKGISKLNEAEKSGDQAKIDAAQQDICSNAFIGITSAFGLRGAGKAFRTSSATAEGASSATARTSGVGRGFESLSNFGRDMTVNAFRATKYKSVNGLTPSFTRLRSWEKQYNIQNKQMADMYTQKLAQLDEQILAETNPAKKALLQEEKQFLEANYAEYTRMGRTIKTKDDYDKLTQDNIAQFNQEYVLDTYTRNAAGEYNIGGQLISRQNFFTFQNRIMRQQRAIERELKQLIKAKENMMRSFARNPRRHRTALNEYVPTTSVERSFFRPSTWTKSKEMLAIGGKNPGYSMCILRGCMTTPASTLPKAIGTWVDPIHSGAFLLTMDMSKEDYQAQLDAMQTAIDGIKNLKEKMLNAQTIEEYNAALTEYEYLVAAANGEQIPTDAGQQQELQQQELQQQELQQQ